MQLDFKIYEVSGVGLKVTKKLARLEIHSVKDLLYHFPRHYLDFSNLIQIAKLNEGELATIHGQIWQLKTRRRRGGLFLTQAKIIDKTGTASVTWFGKPYLGQILKTGDEIFISGKVTIFEGKISFTNPEFEKGNKKIHTRRLIPIYPETEGLSSKWLRTKISSLLLDLKGKIAENLPKEVLKRQKLPEREKAFVNIHFPKSQDEAQEARERFAFEELFFIEFENLFKRQKWAKEKKATSLILPKNLKNKFEKNLPFTLTLSQKRVINEVLDDLSKKKAALRLISGDVGSGKTVVAAFAALAAATSLKKTIIAAPTEILTFQHHKTLSKLLSPFKISISLYTRSHKGSDAQVIVGTHALIHKKKPFENVGLVIIDEQHRFGVRERAKITKQFVENGIYPHYLTMTATPIPRSLALIIWGDVDLSLIDELPKGRKTPKTYIVPKEKRTGAYQFLRAKIDEGRQAFIICPFVSESETFETVKAATSEFERLKKDVFPDLKLGLVHGKLKSKEKEEVIDKFSKKKLDILVATPIVEVGIDIPNATVMIIEGAERFGLAQLHQLRGRIARSTHEAFCFLFSETGGAEAKKRLVALKKIDSGFKLAEIDLKLRGPGEVYGTKQHGFPQLKIADLTNLELIEKVRKEAQIVLKKNQGGDK